MKKVLPVVLTAFRAEPACTGLTYATLTAVIDKHRCKATTKVVFWVFEHPEISGTNLSSIAKCSTSKLSAVFKVYIFFLVE